MLELQSPRDTHGWKPGLVSGVETWIDPTGQVWVRARTDEEPDAVVTFIRTLGLPPLRLMKQENSGMVVRARRAARRAQRELSVRGLD